MFDIFKPFVDPDQAPAAIDWPTTIEWETPDPKGYRASEALAHAVNVAIQLGKPLLVTGEPGTGKTQLPYGIAYQLSKLPGLKFDATPLRFDTKSTSVATDLFYSYDLLGRYAEARIEGEAKAADKARYLTLNAMGVAIVWTHGGKHDLNERLPAELRRAEPSRAVVLIDEIDKAPRDFPNDLLNEIERFEFNISELNQTVKCLNKDWRPVVVITSNSEKNLPDAFLRRCVYHHIEFPDAAELDGIVGARLGETLHGKSVDTARASHFFYALRDARPALEKKPGTAEYLNWLDTLSKLNANGADFFQPDNEETIRKSLTALVKTRDDAMHAGSILTRWLDDRK
jgi:MoxR-like ATPase